MNKLCCGTNLFASHPLEIALKEIAARGIKAVDLWASPTLCNHVSPRRDDPEEIRKLLARYDMTAVSLTTFLITDEERFEAMKFAQALGIPLVIWEPAQSVDWHDNMTNLRPESVPFGRIGGSIQDYFAKLREYLVVAETLNLKIGIEVPHRYTLNEYTYQIWRTCQAISDERLGFVIAPPHADARGFTANDVLDVIGASRASMLYLWDVQKDFTFPESDGAFGAGEQQMPGGGKRDFAGMIRYFKKQGFDGWYNISCHGVEAWTDLDRIRTCLDKAIALANTYLGDNGLAEKGTGV